MLKKPMRHCVFPLVVFLLFFQLFASAQTNTDISGKVISFSDNKALAGVSVTVRGSTVGTTTDTDGNFRIKASPTDVLDFTFTGYVKREISVAGQTSIDVTLVEGVASALNEVVVIGYGTQRRSDLTSAIGSVSGKQLQAQPVQNTESLLEGKVAGLTVTPNGGEPGDNGKVRIRGVGTFGNNSPLYVVDGIPVNNGLNFLNPSDIENVQVFKDAAAAAIYGNRAANGVVYITTKKGKAGKRQINFSTYYGTAKNQAVRPMANASEFWDFVTAKGMQGPYVALHQLGQDNNWVDAITRTGSTQNYNLSVSGGSGDHQYFSSVDYSKVQGTQNASYNERFTGRLNSSHKLFSFFRLGEDFAVSSEKRQNNNVYQTARYIPNLTPIYKSDSAIAALSPADRPLDQYFDVLSAINIANNPVAQTARNFGLNKWLSLYGNVQGEIDFGNIFNPLEGLKFTSTLGFERIDNDFSNFSPIYALGSRDYSTKTSVQNSHATYFHWTFNNFLTYNKAFGKSTVGATVGIVAEEETNSSFTGSGSTAVSNDPYLRVLDAQTADLTASGNAFQHNYESYVGRVTYNYDDRYLLQASIRRDGSYRFAPDKRWGTFPSVGLGWRISNEKFFQNVKTGWLSDLKFRASWGQLGNEKIQSDYPYISQINGTVQRGYVLGGVGGDNSSKVFVQGYGPTNLANPDLTWETTTSTNIGTDIGLFKDKVQISFDYFWRHTTNVLYQKTLPLYSGVPASDGIAPVTQWVNGAEIQNHGFEFTVNYTTNFNKLGMHVGGYIAAYNATVSSLSDNIPIQVNDERIPLVITMKKGDPLGAFYGYKTVGFYNTAAELLNKDGHEIQPGAQVGDFKFADLNGDGVITDQDKSLIGNPNPTFTYSLNLDFDYAGFDLKTFWNGSYGNKIYTIGDIYLGGWDPNGAQNVYADVPPNSWTESHQNALYPIANAGSTQRNYQKGPNSYQMQDGSFFRLRNLQIGYTFPNKTFGKTGISNFRIYFSAENVFVITKYKGDDPEVGNGIRLNANEGGQANSPSYIMGLDYGDRYPIQKTYTFGLSVNL